MGKGKHECEAAAMSVIGDQTLTLAFQTDTKLAELSGKMNTLEIEASSAFRSLSALTVDKENHQMAMRRRTTSEIISQAEALISGEDGSREQNLIRSRVTKYLEAFQDASGKLYALRSEALPLEETFEEHRWSRFFLVTSSQGHVHSSMDCSTCFESTQYGWLPTLSGLTEADAVVQEGSILCSVCFPSAPSEWTTGISKTQAEREAGKEQKAKQKAEKEAIKQQRKEERAQKCYERALAAIEKHNLELGTMTSADLYAPELTKLPSTVWKMICDLKKEQDGGKIERWSQLPLVRR